MSIPSNSDDDSVRFRPGAIGRILENGNANPSGLDNENSTSDASKNSIKEVGSGDFETQPQPRSLSSRNILLLAQCVQLGIIVISDIWLHESIYGTPEGSIEENIEVYENLSWTAAFWVYFVTATTGLIFNSTLKFVKEDMVVPSQDPTDDRVSWYFDIVHAIITLLGVVVCRLFYRLRCSMCMVINM